MQTMEVLLAGHNMDYDIIREIAAEHPERQDLTPETVAAAYARISRNPRPVNELRTLARGEVEKARASNRNIVFEMGHSSIAEHAVFNLDVLKVSRLLVEEIEKFRLASYTEKSQRYVLFKDDFVIPAEVRTGRSGGDLHRNRPGAEPLLPRALRKTPPVCLRPAPRARRRPGQQTAPRRLGEGGRPLHHPARHGDPARDDRKRPEPRTDDPAPRRLSLERGEGIQPPAP